MAGGAVEGAVIWVVAAPEDATSSVDGEGSGAVEKASGAVVTSAAEATGWAAAKT